MAGPGRKGRQPGGRLNKQAAQLVLDVFTRLGGVDAMTAWAAANPTEFYCDVFTKLLPKQAHLTVDDAREVEARAPVPVIAVHTTAQLVEASERLTDEYLASSDSRHGGDEGEVERQEPPHEVYQPSADAGSTDSQLADSAADAPTARQDDELSADPTLLVPDYVPGP